MTNHLIECGITCDGLTACLVFFNDIIVVGKTVEDLCHLGMSWHNKKSCILCFNLQNVIFVRLKSVYLFLPKELQQINQSKQGWCPICLPQRRINTSSNSWALSTIIGVSSKFCFCLKTSPDVNRKEYSISLE